MTKWKHALKLPLLAIAAAIAIPASAAIVVDTGTPPSLGSLNPLGGQIRWAGLFTLAAATKVTSVEGYFVGSSNMTVSIYTGGVDPGFSGFLHAGDFINTSPNGAWQGVFGKNWTLAAGQYWAVFYSTEATSMKSGAPNPLSQYATTNGQNIWSQAGSAKSLGVRISGDLIGVVNPVPEPGTWTMMIFGFGLVGSVMRRRAPTVSYAQ